MDGETMKKDTLAVLKEGIEFLSSLPRFRGDLEQKKEEIERSWQELQERWSQIKSIVVQDEDVKLKEKQNISETIKQKFPTLGRRRKRSASASEVLNVTTPIYSNVPLEQQGSTLSLKPKRSFRMKFNLTNSSTCNSLCNTLVPCASDTLVTKKFGVEAFDITEFTMSSDGRFDLAINGVKLEIGNSKISNLYCCLQNVYLLFGPKLNGQAPLRVLNLESCEVMKTKNKKTILLSDLQNSYSIQFPRSEDYKLWNDKISGISSLYQEVANDHPAEPNYATVEDVSYEVSSLSSVNDFDNYSYVREERHFGDGVGECGYSYVKSTDCRDCVEAVERKTSTADAVIDRGYLNVMKGVDTGRIKDVRYLVSQFNHK